MQIPTRPYSRYSEAAELYRQVVDPAVDHPLTQRYLVALYNAGLYREALVLARALRGGKESIPVVTEVEAAYHQKLSLLDLVLTTLTSGRNPDRALKRLRIALRERFTLLPTVLRPIFQAIDLWIQRQRLQGGLVRLE